jgi:crotonobetainyl-CoA:carnitine CoA-transferase CaiB-like acyl-CoA transferase
MLAPYRVLDLTNENGLLCGQILADLGGDVIEIAHEMFPAMTIESSRLRFSRTPARHPERALCLGRDDRYVLETILGYSSERIADLAARGVLC